MKKKLKHLSDSKIKRLAYYLSMLIYKETFRSRSIEVMVGELIFFHKSRSKEANILKIGGEQTELAIREGAKRFFAEMHADLLNLELGDVYLQMKNRNDWIMSESRNGRQHEIAWSLLVNWMMRAKKLSKSFHIDPGTKLKWLSISGSSAKALGDVLRNLLKEISRQEKETRTGT